MSADAPDEAVANVLAQWTGERTGRTTMRDFDLERLAALGIAEGRKAAFGELMQTDQAWSLLSIVTTLVDAADHLMHAHDCDAHGWELNDTAMKEGRKWLAARAKET